ncbi:MAG: hypothetical protein A2X12_04005 [Bacteroidetes bacterium GWE2_29_8]|nr:MAG: hypothetical protein A2X12_04005 [Bacteroidetes bacterium GWE2_29_8]OFY18743.1 MAG: hypothetical protein A2X02_04325 [Bacteroidetes bacterium GWF2_29_10]
MNKMSFHIRISKYTLLLLFVNLSLFVFSQTDYKNQVSKIEKINYTFKPELPKTSAQDIFKIPMINKINKKNYKSNGATKIKIASSVNIYTSILENSSCLSYSPKFNVISYTYRAGGELGGTGNDVKIQNSINNGANWTNFDIIVNGENNVDVKNCRYPSGVLFNPAGNEQYSQALMVVTGSNTIGTGTLASETTEWEENYYASVKIDGSNKSVVYKKISLDSMQLFPRVGLVATETAVYVLGMDTLQNRIILNKGIYENNIINWTPYPINLNGKYEIYDYNMAWANDGINGYIVFTGKHLNDTIINDSIIENNFYSPQPIVLKTINGGSSWSIIKYNFSNLTELYSKLRYTSDNVTKRPFFNEGAKLVVDTNNNLHIFAIVASASSSHPDSLNYYWITNQMLYKFKFDGLNFDAIFIDSVIANNVKETDNAFTSNVGGTTESVGWDHRLNAVRDKNGSKIFCVWTDTEWELYDASIYSVHINVHPDIKAMGIDVNTGLVTTIKNFTKNTDYEYNNFFLYTSNIAIKSGSLYTIPATTVDISNSMGPVNVQNHYYFNGIVFDETHFAPLGVEKMENNLKYTIYPNPTKDKVFIQINTDEEFEIILHNVLGKEVYRNKYANDEKEIELSLNNLKSGVYFCNIKNTKTNYSVKIIKE